MFQRDRLKDRTGFARAFDRGREVLVRSAVTFAAFLLCVAVTCAPSPSVRPFSTALAVFRDARALYGPDVEPVLKPLSKPSFQNIGPAPNPLMAPGPKTLAM